MENIGQLISSYGFPIVAYLLMFYFANTTIKSLQETITELKIAVVSLTNKLDGDSNAGEHK